MGPGDSLGFQAITLDYAQALDASRYHAFAKLALTLAPVRAHLLDHRKQT